MENDQQAYVLNSNDYSIREFNSTLSKTFTRMFTGLLITALAAIITYGTSLILFVEHYYWLLAIAEIIMVLVFSLGFKKLSPTAVTALFYGYAILNGVTLSTIFIVYDLALILIGIIATIINLLLGSTMFSIILDWVMLFIFAGLTIYDMNKMKMMSQTIQNDSASLEKMYIYCAMELYLDFINIFLRILRILGRANRK